MEITVSALKGWMSYCVLRLCVYTKQEILVSQKKNIGNIL